jgi:hypothetical protein
MTSGELGWYTDDAIVVAEWLLGRGAAIDSAELWLAKNAAVQPHIQASSGVVPYRYSTDTLASETWELFVHRTLKDVTACLAQIQMASEHDWNQPSRRSAFASPESGKTGLRKAVFDSRHSP